MSESKTRKFEEIQVPVPWGQISGKWWGPRDKDPVIAIHGWQDNAGTFDNLAPLLPENIALLCIDLPGHGLSSHLPRGLFIYLWWESLIALRRVVLHLRLKRVSLMGHSLGGAVCFLYAAIYSDDVKKLISLDIVCPHVEKLDIDLCKLCIDRFLTMDDLPEVIEPSFSRDEILDIAEDSFAGSVSRANCEILFRRGIRPSVSNPQQFNLSRDPRVKITLLGSLSKDHVLQFAENVRCEYLYIRAKSGLAFPFPELSSMVLNIIKSNASWFEVHHVKGRHHVHLEDAPAVSNIISTFLNREEVNTLSHDIVI